MSSNTQHPIPSTHHPIPAFCFLPSAFCFSCRLLIWLVALLALGLPARAEAHSGPPYVVVQEQPAGPYVATVWADPDVGEGSFIIDITTQGAAPSEGTAVNVQARPLDGQSPAVSATADRQTGTDDNVYLARLPFAQAGRWAVQVVIDGPGGPGELSFEVDVTPTWSGWFTNLLCFLPFIGLAALWLYGLRRQQRTARVATLPESQAPHAPADRS